MNELQYKIYQKIMKYNEDKYKEIYNKYFMNKEE